MQIYEYFLFFYSNNCKNAFSVVRYGQIKEGEIFKMKNVKKILIAVMAIVLTVGCVCAFAACNKGGKTVSIGAQAGTTGEAYIKGDAEGLVNIPQQIKGLKLSVSLREDTDKPNLVWVSLRSVDDFPCNQMAEQFFNGGGHLNASGGRLNCSIDEAVEIVENALKAYENKLK